MPPKRPNKRAKLTKKRSTKEVTVNPLDSVQIPHESAHDDGDDEIIRVTRRGPIRRAKRKASPEPPELPLNSNPPSPPSLPPPSEPLLTELLPTESLPTESLPTKSPPLSPTENYNRLKTIIGLPAEIIAAAVEAGIELDGPITYVEQGSVPFPGFSIRFPTPLTSNSNPSTAHTVMVSSQGSGSEHSLSKASTKAGEVTKTWREQLYIDRPASKVTQKPLAQDTRYRNCACNDDICNNLPPHIDAIINPPKQDPTGKRIPLPTFPRPMSPRPISQKKRRELTRKDFEKLYKPGFVHEKKDHVIRTGPVIHDCIYSDPDDDEIIKNIKTDVDIPVPEKRTRIAAWVARNPRLQRLSALSDFLRDMPEDDENRVNLLGVQRDYRNAKLRFQGPDGGGYLYMNGVMVMEEQLTDQQRDKMLGQLHFFGHRGLVWWETRDGSGGVMRPKPYQDPDTMEKSCSEASN